MTTGEAAYDDAVARTRQSWLRTALVAAAVTLLLVRGLVVAGAPRWSALGAVLPGTAMLAVALVRARAMSRPVPVMPFAVAVVVAAGAGVLSVVTA